MALPDRKVAAHEQATTLHIVASIPGHWEPMRFRKAGLKPPARFCSEAQWKAREAAK